MSDDFESAQAQSFGVRTIRARIREASVTFSPAEHRVAATLLENYPVVGLAPLARFAQDAGVSGPTVLRFVGKLGFGGYAEFRESLREEVAAQLHSPLESYRSEPSGSTSAFLAEVEQIYLRGLRSTLSSTDPAVFDRVTDALADGDRHIWVTGGRFSATLATHLTWYLQVLRPGVVDLPSEDGSRARALLSVDDSAVVVAYDFRRYQLSTQRFLEEARERGATTILICDEYMSPLARHADEVLTASVVGAPPFDSVAHALILTEALISATASRLGESARRRLTAFEARADGIPPARGGERL